MGTVTYSQTGEITGASDNYLPSETSGNDVGCVTWQSFYDWFIGKTNGNSGVNADINSNAIAFNEGDFNDLKSLLNAMVGSYQLFDHPDHASSLVDLDRHTEGADFRHDATDINYTPSGGTTTSVKTAIDSIKSQLAHTAGSTIAIELHTDSKGSCAIDVTARLENMGYSSPDGTYRMSLNWTFNLFSGFLCGSTSGQRHNVTLADGDMDVTFAYSNQNNPYTQTIQLSGLSSDTHYILNITGATVFFEANEIQP